MPKQTNTASQSQIRVLLVEDHTLTRIGLKTVLKRASDVSVIGEAVNGEEAVAAAEKLQPDVILMDVGMPIMDGIQAAKKILSQNPAIHVIMLTQHDNEQDILSSLAAGASGYCLKDVEPERLCTAIRSVNSGDAWLDASIASRILKHYISNNEHVNPAQAAVSVDSVLPPHMVENHHENTIIEPLSTREIQVLQLIVDGLSNQEIADKLFISLSTAKTHVRNILNKLTVDDRTQAAVYAMKSGLV